jgi:acyl-CoA reductase-like NAD-dependent aldehyde dehydrogenase
VTDGQDRTYAGGTRRATFEADRDGAWRFQSDKAFEMAPKVLAGIVNVNSPTVNDEIHAPMGGVRDSGWGRTGPRSLDDFSDVIWIDSHSGQRQYPL